MPISAARHCCRKRGRCRLTCQGNESPDDCACLGYSRYAMRTRQRPLTIRRGVASETRYHRDTDEKNADREMFKAVAYGDCAFRNNSVCADVGQSPDTADSDAEGIREWSSHMTTVRYPTPRTLSLRNSCRYWGRNSCRLTLWKREPQSFATQRRGANPLCHGPARGTRASTGGHHSTL
jgi:hypothetical protein